VSITNKHALFLNLFGKKEKVTLGQGAYIFCEWDSIQKEYPDFQRAFADLEAKAVNSCTDKWFPKLTPQQAFGFLTPNSDQFGRTSILPALFDDNASLPINNTTGAPAGGGGSPAGTWRQLFTSTGHQMILQGVRGGEVIPEDFQIAWIGLAFPNKQQQITEIRWQTSDRKYGRINIEEMHSYNKPAIIFEEGFLLKEEQAFHLYGYVEELDYQRIVMLGAAYYKVIDKVLGLPGSAI